MIVGTSGKHGGYKLLRSPDAYSVGEIIALMEGTIAPVACLAECATACPRAEKCRTLPMWTEFYELERNFFYEKKLSDLI
jgi:Rrf2 family protein